MAKYISFGQFNKKYFYILGSLIVRIIITFIIGFTPSLTPGKTLYIFGFRSNLFSHPLITYCFQYFSLCLGGIILELIFRDKKKDENDENASRIETNTTFTFSFTKTKELNATTTNLIFNDKNKSKDLKYFLRIFLVYSLYYFAKLTMNSFDNIGFNRVKYWPFEFIFLYIFSKKILKKIFYTHQILSVSILILICTTISLINSFIPQSNEDCSKFSGVAHEECEMLNANVYKDINNKFGWYFIPIIILLYLVSMLSNAYSSITSKWLMDFKYITLNRILIYLGAIGLFYSLILLFIISHIPCSKNKSNFISYVCRITHRNDIFYDNSVNPNTATLSVYADVANENYRLVPGNYVQTAISDNKPDNKTVIPQTAINQDKEGAFVYVALINKEKSGENDLHGISEQRRVVLGDVTDSGEQIIEKGLQEGELVIVQGTIKIQNNSPIKIGVVGK